MSIYTKRGDRGITDMAHVGNISKSDDRIRLMGEADELNSHIPYAPHEGRWWLSGVLPPLRNRYHPAGLRRCK